MCAAPLRFGSITVMLAAAGALTLGACQTSGSSEINEAESGMLLGKLADDQARRVIYKALGARVNRTESLGDEGDQQTELGDDDTFEFTVVNMSRDGFEVLGGKGEQPNELDVEVHGFYKRTRPAAEDGAGPECIAFDIAVKIEKKTEKGWTLAPEQELALAREIPEDCF